jgi:xylulose-5-phosphate/fructose-6-phosphate phosphoketolase
MIYLSGPGHGAPGVLAPTYLDGSYSEIYPDKSTDAAGMQRLLKQFSFPVHIGSHCTPEPPGSIHEGGELGYVLSHACGAVFDNPSLIALTCVGDGEAETGPTPMSTAWMRRMSPTGDGTHCLQRPMRENHSYERLPNQQPASAHPGLLRRPRSQWPDRGKRV